MQSNFKEKPLNKRSKRNGGMEYDTDKIDN